MSFVCDVEPTCGVMLTNSSKMKHYKTHTRVINGMMECMECGDLKANNGWLRHIKTCRELEPILCPIAECEQRLHPSKFENHLQDEHNYPECPRCVECISGRSNWVRHVTACQTREQIECPHPGCEFFGYTTTSITKHLEGDHDGMTCVRHEAPLRFMNFKDLHAHLQFCLYGVAMYTCYVCHLQFKRGAQLVYHPCFLETIPRGDFMTRLNNQTFYITSELPDAIFVSKVTVCGDSLKHHVDHEPMAFRFIPEQHSSSLTRSVLHEYRAHLASFLWKDPYELYFLLIYDTIEYQNEKRITTPLPVIQPPQVLVDKYGLDCSNFFWIKGHCELLLLQMKNRQRLFYTCDSKVRDITDLLSVIYTPKNASLVSYSLLPSHINYDERGGGIKRVYDEFKRGEEMEEFENVLLQMVCYYLHDFLQYHLQLDAGFSIIRGGVLHELWRNTDVVDGCTDNVFTTCEKEFASTLKNVCPCDTILEYLCCVQSGGVFEVALVAEAPHLQITKRDSIKRYRAGELLRQREKRLRALK